MPGKNTIGGKGYKRAKQSSGVEKKNMLTIADDGQQYGLVLKRLGGQFVEVKCSDGRIRKGFLRGAIRKRVWLNIGDIIIVSTRTFTSDEKKCDIIHKYTQDEVSQLEISGLLPEEFIEKPKQKNSTFEFENVSDESSDNENKLFDENLNESESEYESENELNDDDIDNI